MSAQPATQLYSRDSTGLVKLGTPWRMICLNFANIGLTYIMFTYWTHPAVFPKSNLILSLVVASLMIVPFTTLYALFASAMPRTGSEYVYLSRTFHPSVGFAASFAAMVTQSFYSGIGGYWLAQLVLSPLLVAFGGITGNDTWVAWGDWCATKEGGLVFGALFVVLMGALNIAGMRIYYKFQEINWWVGVVTLLLMIYVFLSSTQADFVNAFNDYAMRTAGIENAYQATIDKARAEGMDDAGITVRDTLGIIGIVWRGADAAPDPVSRNGRRQRDLRRGGHHHRAADGEDGRPRVQQGGLLPGVQHGGVGAFRLACLHSLGRVADEKHLPAGADRHRADHLVLLLDSVGDDHRLPGDVRLGL
jgi:hypothetical protein